MPTNKYYDNLEENYANDIIENLKYSKFVKHPLHMTSIDRIDNGINNVSNKVIPKFNTSEWHYQTLDRMYEINDLTRRRMNQLKNLQTSKTQYNEITDLLRSNLGVVFKKSLGYKLSNAFLKLFEILTKMNVLDLTKSLMTFHLAEAPGNFILATKQYLASSGFKHKFDWLANSLNPFDKETVKKYGPVGDTYRLIRNNPNRWLWGKDRTGDITVRANILDIKQRLSKHTNNNNISMNLITGDIGLGVGDTIGDSEVKLLQKLEYAQCISILSIAQNGSNCVAKHFLPFVERNLTSMRTTGFMVSLLYLYALCYDEIYLVKPMTSTRISSEFYVVGKNCNSSLSVDMVNKLYDVLDDFNNLVPLFGKDDIPDEFYYDVHKFYDFLLGLNVENFENLMYVYNCTELEFKPQTGNKCQLFNQSNLDNIRDELIKKWMAEFKVV